MCIACSTDLVGNEKFVCADCLANLPFTNFWNTKDNPVSEVFWGRVLVENAASLVFFEKGSAIQHILHQLKYGGNAAVGVVMGKYLGAKLAATAYSDVDMLIPVPLHKNRKRKRGYNQSECIARGIAAVFNKPVCNTLVTRQRFTKTQTSKSRFERWLNVDGVFKISDPKPLMDKHILVVDDVLTTGATAESLIQELLKVPGVKVSFVALAHA